MTNYDWIPDNRHKSEYVNFIKSKKERPIKKKVGYHLHHIKPRHYFVDENIEVDNSGDNLVSLTPAEHAYAHYLLCMATNNYKDHCALWRTTRGNKGKTLEDYLFLNDYKYPSPSEEVLEKLRNVVRTDEQKEVYREKSKNNTNAKGHKVSDESRNRMRELKLGKDTWNKNKKGMPKEKKRTFFNLETKVLEKDMSVTKMCKKYELGTSSMSMLANNKKKSFRNWVCLDNLQPSQRQEILNSLEGSEVMG